MPMTITEKILAAHADKREVRPGELITCRLDMLMGNDITAPIAIKEFEKVGAASVFEPDRLAIVLSHFVPAKDIKSADQCRIARDFAKKHRLKYFFDEGRGGIEHILLPQEGLVVPGDIVLGADSHSCTYGGLGCFGTGVGSTDLAAAMITGETWFKVPESMKFHFYGRLAPWSSAKDLILYAIGQIGVDGATYRAMEFTGEVVERLPVDQRLTLCNMAIEAGGKSGIVAADEITLEYVKPRAKRPWRLYTSDAGAAYHSVREWDAGKIGLQVACPYSPDNVKPLPEVAGIEVDQVFIGSCTNARMEDLRIAARIMRGKKVAPYVRCIVIPATHAVFQEALREGLIEVFSEAGCAISEATCGPCLGGYNGVLGAEEVCLSTSNRNFPGRMGHPKAKVYLASPAVAAATAVTGKITHPEEVART
ncbi:MAG: 3-isopropylmalate dehydratase large subunit [Candidatus Rokubacteria bacterium]|nr:3-isopropylmalate dehydratase large subunit [Candidatus Rokubacteria bacterium]